MNDLASLELKGPVSTLRSESSQWDPEAKNWTPRNSAMTHFRPDGQISEVEYQNSDGSVSRTINEYDSASRLKESRNRSSNGSETRDLYHYDSSSRLTRVAKIDQYGLQQDSAIYSYDETGRKTAQHFVPFEAGNTAMSFSAGMGESEGTAESVWYDLKHQFLRRVTYTRDPNAKLLKEEVHVDDAAFGELKSASAEQRQGLMDQLTKLFGPDRVMASTSYLYDERGRRIEQRNKMADMADNRITYTYDDRGNPVDEVSIFLQRERQVDETGKEYFANESSQTTRVHYDYQYDAHGNWTERVTSTLSETSSTPQPSSIERREISYYPTPDPAKH
jgi:hypothetical protein